METRKMIAGIVVVVLVLMSGTARATQYYVSPDGNDNNSGLSWETAFATISKGINTSSNGDTIDVNEGTYYETIDFGGKAIEMRGTEPNDWGVVAATIIDANNASADAVTFDSGEDANSVLRGLTVTGATVGVYADSVGPVISRCILHGSRTGVKYTKNSTGTLIVNNKIYDCNGYGVFGHKGDATIKSNWIYDSDKGIKLSSGASADIYNNTIVNNISFGIDKGGGGGTATISNCIIWDCNDDLEGCSATYSCISDCGDAGGTGNICGDGNDPDFVDAASDDYHILRVSPCVDAGDPCYVPDSNEKDIDNNARVRGMAVDMGADEDPPDWYVDDNREESNGAGKSWDDAFKYLQDALANSELKSGHVIWVAQGIYKPTTNPTNRSASFQLKAGVTIKGGYAGLSESGIDRDKRDIHKYETILSGDIDGDDLLDGENSEHVITGAGDGADEAVLDGFTIKGGNANATVNSCGGGFYMWSGWPPDNMTLRNCVIKDNRANRYGGGVCSEYVTMTIENCFFVDNTGGSGGGVFIYHTDPTLVNCVFSGNEAASGMFGGGALRGVTSSPTITNCTFSNNVTAALHGGLWTYEDAVVTNCIFWGNSDSTGNGESAQLQIGGTATVNYSTIEGWTGGLGGTENNGQNPKFVIAELAGGWDGIFGTFDDSLRLQTDSPCVDSGSNSAINATGVNTDIIGNPRKMDGNRDSSRTVDRGAYELPLIWYVDESTTCTSGCDGSSWDKAYIKLRDAISYISGLPGAKDGNEIWVADGVYEPHASDQAVSFNLINGVPIRGGYAGHDEDESDPYTRDIDRYETILSGDIDSDGHDNGNSWHVVAGADRGALEGFTITGGYADGDGGGSGDHGAGIYCDGVSPTITKCTIKYNKSEQNGGGIYCNNGSPRISYCAIHYNETFASGNGGGMYCSGGSNAVVANCTFIGNVTFQNDIVWTRGGGMCNEQSSPTVINCVFSRNRVYRMGSGGGMYNNESSPKVINCVFDRNQTDETGGGMYNDNSSPVLVNCTFSRNYADYYSYGAGIADDSCPSYNITNCVFWGNTTYNGDTDQAAQIYGTPNVMYSCIQNLERPGDFDDVTNIGDLSAHNPDFIDADDPEGPDGAFGTQDDGLRIMAYSPCVDQADDTVEGFLGTDITGRLRIDISNTLNDDSTADMGAYESPVVWFVKKGQTYSSSSVASWTNAFGEVSDAFVHMGLAAGDEIWVAGHENGYTYKPDTSGLGDKREATFQLVSGIDVFGGFEGDESKPQWSDPLTYKTILSGDIQTPDDDSDNSYHVVMGVDDAVLDGFIVELGNADGASEFRYGGGMYNYNCTPEVRNCTFRNNYAELEGGAISNRGAGSDITVTGCIFKDNKAPNGKGGAIANWAAGPAIEGCFFINNEADGGGGIYNYDTASRETTVINSLFYANSATYGGGMYNYTVLENKMPRVVNCTFSQNTASYGNSVRNLMSHPEITNCIMWNRPGQGDEVSNDVYSNPTITYCDIMRGTVYPGEGNKNEDPLFKNPLSYWRFDEGSGSTAYDASFGGNDGAINGASWDNDVVRGTCLSFGGDGDHVDTADEPFDFGSDTDFTISVWIKTSSFSSMRIVDKSLAAASPYTGFSIWIDSSGLVSFKLEDDNGDSGTATTTTNCANGAWHNIVGVADRDGDVAIYHNGDYEDSSSLGSVDDIDNNVDLAAGKSMDLGSEYFNGKLDEVMVFRRALSAKEVGELYANGNNGGQYDLAAGPDGIVGTSDDGFRFEVESPCVDVGDNSAIGLSKDIIRNLRKTNIMIKGIDTRPVTDMGAYEFPLRMVVMCLTDESSEYSVVGLYGDWVFDGDLYGYQGLFPGASGDIAKTGCLVPNDDRSDVLPTGYTYDPGNPRAGITVELFPHPTRQPYNRAPTLNDYIAHFDRIREEVVPDCVIFILDKTGSMSGFPWDSYNQFRTWLKQSANYPYAELVEREFETEAAYGWRENWVNEIRKGVAFVIDSYCLED